MNKVFGNCASFLRYDSNREGVFMLSKAVKLGKRPENHLLNIRIMDHAQRSLPTWFRPPIVRLRRRKRNLVLLNIRERAHAKERDADEPRRLGPEVQTTETMRDNRSFESNSSLADIVISNLQSHAQSAHRALDLSGRSKNSKSSQRVRKDSSSFVCLFTFSRLHALEASATKTSSPRAAASFSWRSVA